jgi:hypothetical protein
MLCAKYTLEHHADGSWGCKKCGHGSTAGWKTCPKCQTAFRVTAENLKYSDGSAGADFCEDCLTKLKNNGRTHFAKVMTRHAKLKSAQGGFKN